jgi:hypothetical protein
LVVIMLYRPIEINPYEIMMSNERVRLITIDEYDKLFMAGELK